MFKRNCWGGAAVDEVIEIAIGGLRPGVDLRGRGWGEGEARPGAGIIGCHGLAPGGWRSGMGRVFGGFDRDWPFLCQVISEQAYQRSQNSKLLP